MKTSNKLKIIVSGFVLFLALFSLAPVGSALVTPTTDGQPAAKSQPAPTTTTTTNQTQTKGDAINQKLQKNPIIRDVRDIVNFLSAGVGIVVVAMIMVGGIQYSIAGDNPQKVTDAKKRIANALIALVVFLFIFAFVQWLIPGGIFS